MVKTQETEAATPQPVPQQYQTVYAQPAPKVAKHPGMELSLAVFSILASAWLLVDAITGMIALFGGGRTPTFDPLSSLLFGHLNSYVGVVIVSLAAVAFAGAAFWLLRRLSTALASDSYKAALHVGAGIAGVKTLVLAITAVAVGLTPLLTIEKGSDVGPAYLYDFLPAVLATGLFVFVVWGLLQLVDRKRVASMLSSVLLIAASLVFVLAFVAVIVRSHSGGSGERTNTSAPSSQSSGKSMSDCYDEYSDGGTYSEYSKCLSDALDDE